MNSRGKGKILLLSDRDAVSSGIVQQRSSRSTAATIRGPPLSALAGGRPRARSSGEKPGPPHPGRPALPRRHQNAPARGARKAQLTTTIESQCHALAASSAPPELQRGLPLTLD